MERLGLMAGEEIYGTAKRPRRPRLLGLFFNFADLGSNRAGVVDCRALVGSVYMDAGSILVQVAEEKSLTSDMRGDPKGSPLDEEVRRLVNVAATCGNTGLGFPGRLARA